MPEHDFQNLHMVYEQYFQADAPQPICLKTGFPALDRLLGGGISPSLVVLGGMPGIGKSTLALQIAAHVAENGHPVLYFSMEMSDSWLMAKAVTRKIYEDADGSSGPSSPPVTAKRLLNRSLTEAQRAEVDAVMRTRFLERLHICTETLSASGILERARAFTAQGNPTPLVIVDYLQLLPRERGAQSDKQAVDNNVNKLMELAHGGDAGLNAGFPVLILSALNRDAYAGRNGNSDAGYYIQLSSFKETGGIEYSADVLLSLQYRARLRSPEDIKKEMKKTPRKVEITVLKNRYGESGGSISLQYAPAQDRFFPPDSAVGDCAAEGTVPSDGQPSAGGGIRVIINNTKAAKELRTGRAENPACMVLPKDNVCISYCVSEPLASLDLCVADAVYSLYMSQKKISVRTVWHVLLGKREGNPTSKQQEQLEESIQRLRAAELKLDCQEHLARMKKEPWSYKGPFLRLAETGKRGSWDPDPSEKAGILPLHTYGAAVGHTLQVPSALLNVKEASGRSMSSTTDNIGLKWFLIRRLESIRQMLEDGRGGKYLEGMRTISFDPSSNLLQEVRPAEPLHGQAREQRITNLCEDTQTILNYYRRIGYISEVEKSRAGQKAGFPSFRIADERSSDKWTL